MIKELWNVGLKVTDLDREVAFLREVGATLVLRERVPMLGEERDYAILVLGGVRMLLFETVVFEDLVVISAGSTCVARPPAGSIKSKPASSPGPVEIHSPTRLASPSSRAQRSDPAASRLRGSGGAAEGAANRGRRRLGDRGSLRSR